MASLPAVTVAKHKQQNQYFEESLGKGILPLQMMYMPAGSFLMGSPENESERRSNEGPQQKVTLSEFYMARYPVTQVQWQAVAKMEKMEIDLKPNPSNFKGDMHPVEQVNWHEAMEFCARLSQQTKRSYSLPSEAQWEYACRAGTTTPFHFGDMITTDIANYQGHGSLGWLGSYGDGPVGEFRNSTTPVDQFGVANDWGLCDMHGNVWEWCLEHWHDRYEGASTDGSAWVIDSDSQLRILRGGSWNSLPRICRSAYRNFDLPVYRSYFIGFRVMCVLPRTLP